MSVAQLGKAHILLISQDVVGAEMAGPGIRYYHLARTLGREFPVLLALPGDCARDLPTVDFHTVSYRPGDWHSLSAQVDGARAVIFPSDIASDLPQLAESGVPLVVDGYDPMLAEWLPLVHDQGLSEQESRWFARMRLLNFQYLMGDFFICASERQRDWWLGLLEANGRINPYTYGEDASLRRLIDVVPYGLPETPPQPSRPVIKGIWPGISATDRVILWGGGLWSWLDPLTAIRAMERVWERRPDARLVFPGTRRPNPALVGIATHEQAARDLALQLGLLDKAVFFGGWVPYTEWPNVLLESDVALTLHYESTLETRLAFRSRILEYIWAGLPIVTTRGDATSEVVAQNEIGTLVESQDPDGVANAILDLIDSPRQDWQRRMDKVRPTLTWERAAEPLIAFCRQPYRAPDKVAMKGNLGNPFYMSEILKLRSEVCAFETRRIVRLLDRVQRLVPRRSR
ncbi:MAG: glycosyltransferase family 4 protein [Chloroflexi bacterium]|nr:glycosyltransferase family 4 protein [Chloroflexota bacterium]